MPIAADVPLGTRTTLRVGGAARWFALVESDDQLLEALAFAGSQPGAVRVLGAGSNVVVPDAGVDGVVVGMGLRGIRCEEQPSCVRVSARAGEPWDEFVAHTVSLGLTGLECLSGIPGLVGATPIQNVGAYGQEVGETIETVRVYDRSERVFRTLEGRECDFAYRHSRFKTDSTTRFVVTDVSFALHRKAAPALRYPELARALAGLGREPTLSDVREGVLALRRSKSMVLDPSDPNGRSCGSFFVNPLVSSDLAQIVRERFATHDMPRYPQPDGRIKLSAAWLIERSGFSKGTRLGNVGISSRHALALVCHEGARAAELLAFARIIRDGVLERTGVELVPEPVCW